MVEISDAIFSCLPWGKVARALRRQRTRHLLPSGPLQGQLDGCFTALVVIRDNDGNSVKTPVSRLGQDLIPQGFCSTIPIINTECFPGRVSADHKSDNDCLEDSLSSNPGVAVGGV